MSHLARRAQPGAALGWGRGRAGQRAGEEERAEQEQEVEEVLPLPAQGRTGEGGAQQVQVFGQQGQPVQV